MGTGHHGQPRGAADVVVGLQLAGLEDDLEVGVVPVGAGAGLTDGDDLVVHLLVATGQERATVDDHVDLVGSGGDGIRGVGELDPQRCPAAHGDPG